MSAITPAAVSQKPYKTPTPNLIVRTLPDEVMVMIFGCLDAKGLIAAQQTHRTWYALISHADTPPPATTTIAASHRKGSVPIWVAPIGFEQRKAEMAIARNMTRFMEIPLAVRNRCIRGIDMPDAQAMQVRGRELTIYFLDNNGAGPKCTIYNMDSGRTKVLDLPDIGIRYFRRINDACLLFGVYNSDPAIEGELRAVSIAADRLSTQWTRKIKRREPDHVTRIACVGNHLLLCTETSEFFQEPEPHFDHGNFRIRRYDLQKVMASTDEYLPHEEDSTTMRVEISDLVIHDKHVYIGCGNTLFVSPIDLFGQIKDCMHLNPNRKFTILRVDQGHLFAWGSPPFDEARPETNSEIYIYTLVDPTKPTLLRSFQIAGACWNLCVHNDLLFAEAFINTGDVNGFPQNSNVLSVYNWRDQSRQPMGMISTDRMYSTGMAFSQGSLYRLATVKHQVRRNMLPSQLQIFDFNPQFQGNAALVRTLRDIEAAGSKGDEQLVMQRFATLPEADRNKIYERVWRLKGSPMGNPRFGELSFHADASLPKTEHCTFKDKLTVIAQHHRIAQKAVNDGWGKANPSAADKYIDRRPASSAGKK